MMLKVERPAADSSKITTKDDFELCFLRHQYFRRALYNPTEAEMQPYMKIVEHLTKNTFFVYYNLFKSVGMYQDDLLNIGRVHLTSFLGLYSLDRMDTKRKEWAEKFEKNEFKEPELKDYEQKNKANFTMFFKQRMEDLVRVCRQKVRNIKGQPSEEFAVFCGTDLPPKPPRKLLKSHLEFGYRKVDFSVFKSIRKKANVNNDATMFQFNDLWYVAIALEQKNLELEDIVGSGYNPYENIHNMRPDDLYEEQEKQDQFTLFSGKSNFRKKVILRKFINQNRSTKRFKEELVVAKKLLKSLED